MNRIFACGCLGLFGLVLAACGQNNSNPPAPGPPAVSDPRPGGVRALAIDPRDGRLLKAASDGLYESRDAGSSWQPVPLPAALARKGVAQVALRKDQPDLLYLAGEQIGIWRSRDGEKSWEKVTRGLASEQVSALAVHSNGYPRKNAKSLLQDPVNWLFAWVSGVGMFESRDQGDTWERSADQGPANPQVLALVHSPLPESMNTGWLYASTPDGAFLSMD